ncbi:MAG: S41 family peptidase [Bacteroidales bacterium]
MRRMSRKIRVMGLALIILVALVTTGFLVNQESRDFRIGKNLDIFYTLYRELNTFYVDEINPDKIIKTGIDNMLRSLDPYTVYYQESETDELSFMTTGKYGGIGCLVRNAGDYAIITNVYKGFPADQAGIKAGDIIKKVDGATLKSIGPDKVSDKLKGDPGTPIVLTVERNGKESDFQLKRERIAIPAVPYSGMLDGKTGYIRFSGFTQNCIDDVKKALVNLEKNNPEGIILDLRGNPGGLLTEAVEIVNLFVGPGSEVVSTKGKVKQFDGVYKTTSQAIDEKIPLVVLINSGSASASEIVAGAIQDLDRGVIIGQRSYGKGLVQITRPLSYNTQLKVTTAKYYIPSGRCIQAVDYTHRNEDGSVGYVPDSLISEFKTKKGRVVKDGGGITPDITLPQETLSQIATELYLRNFIFDFSTEYFWKHQSVTSLAGFQFTDADYNDFRDFLVKRKFSYKTGTEEALGELIDNAKKEKYYENHKELFTSLEKDLGHNLDEDLKTFKPEITELLGDEIAGRYFYESGAIELSLRTDSQVRKAIEVLKDKQLYASILDGKSGSILMADKDNTPLKGKK